jgi:hypothetical protein
MSPLILHAALVVVVVVSMILVVRSVDEIKAA